MSAAAHGHGAEHGHGSPENKRVALLIAVLALILAFSETLGKSAQTAALSYNIEASNLWSFVQAKTIRMTTLRTAAEQAELGLKQATDPKVKEALEQRIAAWRKAAERYALLNRVIRANRIAASGSARPITVCTTSSIPRSL